ncbi:MAG: DUF3783 domain-containing protein [Spirochaetales bacterium]|nr:DUF3783 domain-containing protein [Spirochaetales bacterium]
MSDIVDKQRLESDISESLVDEKVVLLNGFSREEVFAILKAVKAVVSDPKEVAFATSTPVNLDWKFKDIISDVSQEHKFFMQKNKKG